MELLTLARCSVDLTGCSPHCTRCQSEPSDHYFLGSQLQWRVTHGFFLSAMDNLQERALHIRKVLLVLPKTTLIIMRYLFAFLNQ